MWGKYYPALGPEVNGKVRRWAHDNAFTLIFLAVMFAVTWTLYLVVGVNG